MYTIDKLLPEWHSWLEETKGIVTELLINRHIYEETWRIVEANPNTHDPNDFVMWFQRLYARSTAVAVRRMVDQDKRTHSLVRLLEHLKCHARDITRDWFCAQHSDSPAIRDSAHRVFDQWSIPGGDCVDPGKVSTRIEKLKNVCKPVKYFVDKRVAHLDAFVPDSSTPKVTWKELDIAIDALDRQTCELVLLLEQKGVLGGLRPTWQYDWTTVFRNPWLPHKPKRST